jgi:TonB family protein
MDMLPRLIVLLALAAPPSTAVSGQEGRAPTRGWTVNFADAQCLAVRDYGSGQEPLQLVLKSPAIGGVVQVAIVRKGPPNDPAQLKAMVAIDGRPPFEVSMLTFSPKGSGLRIYTMNMRAAEFAPLRQASRLSVRAGNLNELLSVSEMTPLMKVVDECVADLRRVFNITDPETGTASPLQRRATATASLGRLIHSEDYPGMALQRDETGTVKFAMLIDENGRVVDCSVIETSGVAVLDAQACATLKARAQFQPALGPDGKPAKDAITSRIVWNIAS